MPPADRSDEPAEGGEAEGAPDDAFGEASGDVGLGAGPSDRRLIAQLLDGDERALRGLIDRYDRLIRYTIFRAGRRHCTRDPGWLDARANEAWTDIVSALRRRGSRAIPPNAAAYFARIARNKCLDAVARADGQQVLSLDEDRAVAAAAEATSPGDDPRSLLESVEELAVLRDCIARLSEDEQVICSEIGLIMERRWREAAERLEMPESSLRSRWGHILDKLRACLEQKSSKKFRA